MKLLAWLALALSVAATPVWAADQPAVVHITYVASPFNVPSIIMRQQGFLDQAFAPFGVKVDSPEITSGAQQTQAMAAGAVDIASVLGSTSAILAKANGVDIKVVAVYARGPKAYMLMTRADGPKSLADLKGKKIAGPKGTVLNQLLVAALVSQHMTLDDVQYINMDLPTARAALLSGQVDVATLAGNDAIQVEKAGGKSLANGSGLISPTNVVAVRTDFLNQHPDLVNAYLAAEHKALDFMAQHPDDALAIAAKDQKISIDDAKEQMPLYDFSPVLTDQDITNMTGDQTFMVQSSMLPKENAIDIRRDLVAPSAFSIK